MSGMRHLMWVQMMSCTYPRKNAFESGRRGKMMKARILLFILAVFAFGNAIPQGQLMPFSPGWCYPRLGCR